MSDERDLIDRKIAEGWGDTYKNDFSCSGTSLTSLKGAPRYAHRGFYCCGNRLTSLEEAPVRVDGSFYCTRNRLTSLEGAPTRVGGDFCCHYNPIASLAGIEEYFKNGYIKGTLMLPGSLKSHVLGVLMIPGLVSIGVTDEDMRFELVKVVWIINNHLAGDRDILECQEELRSTGLREYGKL